MILTKINKSCHESCHEIAEPLIFQGFWNLILWVQVPSPALTQKSRKHAIFIEKSMVYGFSSLRNIRQINSKFVIKIQNLVMNLVMTIYMKIAGR